MRIIKSIEVFRAGKQTDSTGNSRVWTEADLDQVVANFVAEGDTVPLVVGHPEADHPAYGWVSKVWREGNSLFVAARDVVPQFAEAIAKKVFPNRSVKLLKGDSGWRLGHIGLLGAAAPAVAGLKPISFNTAAEGSEYTFNQETPAMFTQADLDKAASDAAAKAKADAEAANKTKLDAQAEELKKLQFAQRVAECGAVVQGFAIRGQDVHLTPAQVEGLAEFRAQLLEQTAEFTFAAADKTQKKATLVATFDGLLKSLPVQMKLGQEQGKADGAPADLANDPNALAAKALEFQKAEADKGVTISIAQAIAHVSANTAKK